MQINSTVCEANLIHLTYKRQVAIFDNLNYIEYLHQILSIWTLGELSIGWYEKQPLK